MSGNPHHRLRKRGDALARLLDDYIVDETPKRADAMHVRLAVYDYFERVTAIAREPQSPWPLDVEPGSTDN